MLSLTMRKRVVPEIQEDGLASMNTPAGGRSHSSPQICRDFVHARSHGTQGKGREARNRADEK